MIPNMQDKINISENWYYSIVLPGIQQAWAQSGDGYGIIYDVVALIPALSSMHLSGQNHWKLYKDSNLLLEKSMDLISGTIPFTLLGGNIKKEWRFI